MQKKSKAIIFAILAAALYAVNIPLSKYFLTHVEPTVMASLLYLGAGVGIFIYSSIRNLRLEKSKRKASLSKEELPYIILMVVLDILAPILFMYGIQRTNPANVSLLNNFEIVVTSIIAFIFFKEIITRKLALAIVLISIASVILTWEGKQAFVWNEGSILILAAAASWGLENNCTKMLSHKSSEEVVIIKGLFSGLGSFIVSRIVGESFPAIQWIVLVMLLGFFAYGLSINLYVMAQNDLGAAKTSAYYAINPFIGVILSFLLFQDPFSAQFFIALVLMIVSTIILIKDTFEQEEKEQDNASIENLDEEKVDVNQY